jgi:hypothetical protein
MGMHVNYLQTLEGGNLANPQLATLLACALEYRVPLAALFTEPAAPPEPFERIAATSARALRDAVPLYTLRAVAGRFGGLQLVEPDDLVRLRGRTRPAPDLFVAQVVGESMNRRLPSGAFCLFRAPPLPPLDGKALLVQHRHLDDPERGGQYSVKIYREAEDAIRLEPASTSRRFRAATFRGRDRDRLRPLAELVEVLGEPAPAGDGAPPSGATR